MNKIKKHLIELQKIKRKHHHPLIHHIHKKFNISKKTLFYVKEYGEHTNVIKTIIKESIKILILSALLSTIGGIALDQIKLVIISIIPLIILLPILNDMIGDYAIIVSAKISTLLHEGKINTNPWSHSEVKKLYLQILIISVITAVLSAVLAFFLAKMGGYHATTQIVLKIFGLVLLEVLLLVNLLFFITVQAGIYIFKKKEDPNNFLIPITTSIADLGSMILLAILVMLFF